MSSSNEYKYNFLDSNRQTWLLRNGKSEKVVFSTFGFDRGIDKIVEHTNQKGYTGTERTIEVLSD